MSSLINNCLFPPGSDINDAIIFHDSFDKTPTLFNAYNSVQRALFNSGRNDFHHPSINTSMEMEHLNMYCFYGNF